MTLTTPRGCGFLGSNKMERDRSNMMAFREAVIIFISASAIALLFNQFRVNGLDLVGDWSREIYGPAQIEIPLDEAIRQFREGKAVFVDVRSQASYQQGHIPGALNLPYDNFHERLPFIKKKSLPGCMVITYGDDKEFFVSADSAILLQDSGFKDIRVFRDGWPKWKEANLPIKKD